nr:MAG TPA: hypothetical protein [Caudoviricetes sp.]
MKKHFFLHFFFESRRSVKIAGFFYVLFLKNASGYLCIGLIV